MKVVVLSTDLMDRSKISAAVPDAVFVGAAAQLPQAAAGADLVVVDVSRPGVLDVLDGVVAAAGDVVASAPMSTRARWRRPAARAPGCCRARSSSPTCPPRSGGSYRSSSSSSKRCQPASVIDRLSKNRQCSGQAKGAWWLAATRQRCTTSAPTERVE
jgi:hypothetical protein